MALRLFAALCVFHSHHFIVNGLPEPSVPIFVGGLGTFGVYVFFAISGHLVGASALYRNPFEFVWARFLRIQPALVVCISLTVLVGGLVTTAPSNDYFAQPLTDLYWFNNVNIAWAPAVFRLPYVFANSPDQSVNVSLWTIPYEIFCYLLVLLAVLIDRRGILVGTAIVAILLCINLGNGIWMGNGDRPLLSIYNQFDIAYLGNFALIFFASASLNFATPKQMLATLAFGIIGAVAVGDNAIAREPFLMIALSAGAILFGKYVNVDRHIQKLGDISYGFYLYAYPVQQLTTHFLGHGDGVTFYVTYAVALVVTGIAAKISWELVEAPFLTLKDAPGRLLRRLAQRHIQRGEGSSDPSPINLQAKRQGTASRRR